MALEAMLGLRDVPRNPLLRTRPLRQLTLPNALLGLSSSLAPPFVPLWLTTSIGASPTQIGLLGTRSTRDVASSSTSAERRPRSP